MNKIPEKNITVIGGGPVGSLLSIYLSRLTHRVSIYEKRQDPRLLTKGEGRSINLALSHRGLHALKEVGLEEEIKKIAVPMKGRMIHPEKGDLYFQPYGEDHQFINSISRNSLNQLLIDKAEEEGVAFYFNTTCESVDPETGIVELKNGGKSFSTDPAILFGADGAFSVVRNSFQRFPDFTSDQEFLSHGYKELHIPPSPEGWHLMEKNALHIWPREHFMLIALPNLDGSFTATLFLPFKGPASFDTITTPDHAEAFFKTYFPDALPLMPGLKKDFIEMPTSSLVTVHCFPWTYCNNTILMGDAAHAITPFYGQGMNAGFEDCRIFNSIMKEHGNDWGKIFSTYQSDRKENADAIAELALQNFIEMRDLVGDPRFILRKKVESKIHRYYPSYLPLYTMVTFTDLPYKEALIKGKEHDHMMEEIMSIQNIEAIWDTEKGWDVIREKVARYINKKG